MEKLQRFFSNKKNIILVAVLAAIIIASVACVYFFNTSGDVREDLVRQEEINGDLNTAEEHVFALYADESLEFLSASLTDDGFAAAETILAGIAEYAGTDSSMTEEQQARYEYLVQEFECAQSMNTTEVLFGSLFVYDDAVRNGDVDLASPIPTSSYLLAPSEDVDEILSSLYDELEGLQTSKSAFYDYYTAGMRDVEVELGRMQTVSDLVDSFFDSDGAVLDTVTEDQIADAAAQLEEINNSELYAELSEKLLIASASLEETQSTPSTPSASSPASGNGAVSSSPSPDSPGGGANPPAELPSEGSTNGQEEPYIVSGYIGNGGLFDTVEAANQYARDILSAVDENGNFTSPYTGYQLITVLYSDGTIKYSVNMY